MRTSTAGRRQDKMNASVFLQLVSLSGVVLGISVQGTATTNHGSKIWNSRPCGNLTTNLQRRFLSANPGSPVSRWHPKCLLGQTPDATAMANIVRGEVVVDIGRKPRGDRVCRLSRI